MISLIIPTYYVCKTAKEDKNSLQIPTYYVRKIVKEDQMVYNTERKTYPGTDGPKIKIFYRANFKIAPL